MKRAVMDYGFGSLAKAFGVPLALCVIFVPLGAWKAYELLSWFWANIHWGTP